MKRCQVLPPPCFPETECGAGKQISRRRDLHSPLNLLKKMGRAKRFEPSTPTLSTECKHLPEAYLGLFSPALNWIVQRRIVMWNFIRCSSDKRIGDAPPFPPPLDRPVITRLKLEIAVDATEVGTHIKRSKLTRADQYACNRCLPLYRNQPQHALSAHRQR